MPDRTKRASASETYIFSGLKILATFAYIYNQCSFLSLLNMVWRYKRQYTDKTTALRKSMYYASELRKCLHFHILSFFLSILSIFCWYTLYSWYFVGTNNMLVGLQCTYTNSEKNIMGVQLPPAQPMWPWVSIPGGGGWGGYIPNILGGGMACIIIPPPNISRMNVILYRQNIWSTNRIMKEIAGLECRNTRKKICSLCSLGYMDYLDVGVLPAVCEAFIVPCHR